MKYSDDNDTNRVRLSNMIFDFDLFDLMRYVDGKQLMLGRSVT